MRAMATTQGHVRGGSTYRRPQRSEAPGTESGVAGARAGEAGRVLINEAGKERVLRGQPNSMNCSTLNPNAAVRVSPSPKKLECVQQAGFLLHFEVK